MSWRWGHRATRLNCSNIGPQPHRQVLLLGLPLPPTDVFDCSQRRSRHVNLISGPKEQHVIFNQCCTITFLLPQMWLSETGEGSKDNIVRSRTAQGHLLNTLFRGWTSCGWVSCSCASSVSRNAFNDFPRNFSWLRAACFRFCGSLRRDALTRGLCDHPRVSCARVLGRLLFMWQRMSLQLNSCHSECFATAVMRFSGAANLRAVPWPRNSRTQSARGINAGQKQ